MRRSKRCQISRIRLGGFIVAVFAVATTGCNTVRGVGKDITGLSQATEDFFVDEFGD